MFQESAACPIVDANKHEDGGRRNPLGAMGREVPSTKVGMVLVEPGTANRHRTGGSRERARLVGYLQPRRLRRTLLTLLGMAGEESFGPPLRSPQGSAAILDSAREAISRHWTI